MAIFYIKFLIASFKGPWALMGQHSQSQRRIFGDCECEIFTGRIAFLSPNQQRQNSEEIRKQKTAYLYFLNDLLAKRTNLGRCSQCHVTRTLEPV